MRATIAILSSGVKLDKISGWLSTPIDDQDEKSGAPGGNLRVLAASYIYFENQSWPIIVSGGIGSEKNWEKEVRPLLSEILKKELVELGVPAEMIIKENSSNSTYSQLVEINRLVKQRGFDKVLLITNRYHLPRIKAFLENFEEFKDINSRIELIEAEEIVIKKDLNWQKIIDEFYQSPRMKKIIESEQKGVKDIEAGNYKI